MAELDELIVLLRNLGLQSVGITPIPDIGTPDVEAIHDMIAAALLEGINITLVVDTEANTITISSPDKALDDLTNVDLSSGQVGDQYLGVDTDNITWTAKTFSPPPPLPVSLDDITDVVEGSNTDGGVLLFSSADGAWVGDKNIVGNLLLPAGDEIPAGTPPCLVWDIPVSILLTHLIEGTNATVVSAVTEGYDTFTGSAVSYTNAQALVGTTSFLVNAGSTGYFSDTTLDLPIAVLKGRFRTNGTPTGNVNIASASNGVAGAANNHGNIQRQTAGTLVLKDGGGVTRATGTVVTAVNTWYQYEWKVSTSSQTLRLFDSAGVLLEEITGTTTNAGNIQNLMYGVILNLNGSFYFDKSVVAIDWVGTAG